MAAPAIQPLFDASRPLDLSSQFFADNKYDWYRWALEELPACQGKISVLKVNLVTRYDDCRMVLTDDRFIRNRGIANGKGSNNLPFPIPKSIAAIGNSMILQDDPGHRRLRNLVNKAFTPRSIARLSDRVEELSGELLDRLGKHGSADLLETYSRPLPTRVISEMVGVASEDSDRLGQTLGVVTKGMTGLGIVKTLLWDLRATAKFIRGIIERKRSDPGDDILSALIGAEEEGDRLTEDELLAMVFLLMIGGFETTMHMITNGVHTLLQHPEQLERLRAEPELWDSAIEEIVRHRGPVHGTKMQYATEDVVLHGYTIKKGTATMPMLGAANHDPRVFEKPDEFDITRSPNRHLGFGLGRHFCLGRQLALMEARVALKNLFDRFPDLRIAVPESQLQLARMPGWHRYTSMPVSTK